MKNSPVIPTSSQLDLADFSDQNNQILRRYTRSGDSRNDLGEKSSDWWNPHWILAESSKTSPILAVFLCFPSGFGLTQNRCHPLENWPAKLDPLNGSIAGWESAHPISYGSVVSWPQTQPTRPMDTSNMHNDPKWDLFPYFLSFYRLFFIYLKANKNTWISSQSTTFYVYKLQQISKQ